jgi:hypothetical protein
LYYFWWNDKVQGDNSKTLDVCVSFWDDKGRIRFRTYDKAVNLDHGWTNYGIDESIYSGESIYIRVTPKTAGETGTFGIVCSNGDSRTRPPVPTP